MAISPDFDGTAGLPGIPVAGSLLSSDEQLTAGIRVTRAEFARMMGTSRQAVTDWVRAGRVTVGADGRFDPCKAVASLLRTGDPARLRAKILQPLVAEMAGYRTRIAELEAALGQSMQTVAALRAQSAGHGKHSSEDDLEFYRGACDEWVATFLALEDQLPTAWRALMALPADAGLRMILDWLERAQCYGAEGAGPIVPPEAEEKISDDREGGQ